LCLAVVRRQEELTFERERAGDVKQIDGSDSHLFGVRGRELVCAGNGGVQINNGVDQCALQEQMFKASQCRVSLPRDVLARAGSDCPALMECALTNCIANFEGVKCEKK
jgi:hypothetical protein